VKFEYSMTAKIVRSRNPIKRWRERRVFRALFKDTPPRGLVTLTFKAVREEGRGLVTLTFKAVREEGQT